MNYHQMLFKERYVVPVVSLMKDEHQMLADLVHKIYTWGQVLYHLKTSKEVLITKQETFDKLVVE